MKKLELLELLASETVLPITEVDRVFNGTFDMLKRII